jgi:hypothetical protein
MNNIIKLLHKKSIKIFFVLFFLNVIGLYADENIIINKPYKIKSWPFHIFIWENEKCFDGEEWHEVMIMLWEGIIIFGEENIILSETYRTAKNEKDYVLTIIDENKKVISNGNIVGANCKVEINGYNIIIEFYNMNNELVKQIMEIENIYK